jgi:hypothetical protein
MELSFYRRSYTQMWLEITSDEPLLWLDSGGYIEDYYGVGSQVTIRNIATNTTQEILVTDNNPTFLQGYISLDTIVDGTYAFEGRVSDLVNNVAIINQVSNPALSGTVVNIYLTIHPFIGVGAIFSTNFQTMGLNFRLRLIDSIPPDDSHGIDMSLISPDVYYPVGLTTSISTKTNLETPSFYRPVGFTSTMAAVANLEAPNFYFPMKLVTDEKPLILEIQRLYYSVNLPTKIPTMANLNPTILYFPMELLTDVDPLIKA